MAAANISLLTISVTAVAALTLGRAVTAGGAVATAAETAVGIANSDGAVGQRVPVTALGTALAEAHAAIAVGAALEVAALGRLVTRTAGVTVGRALTAAGAQGDQIEVLLIPN
jgi:hypothetical protein